MKYLIPLIVLIVSIVFISCNNPSSKSLMTELTPEEINTLSKRDTLFIYFYEMIEELRSSELSSNSEQSKYIDITYDDLLELIELEKDSSYWKDIYESKKHLWKDQYGKIENQVDSVIEYYNNRYEKNRLDQYVDIEFIEIKKEYFPNTSVVENVSFGFRLTPLVEKIDFIEYQFSFSPKEEEEVSEISLSKDLMRKFNNSTIYSPFSKPIIDYCDLRLYLSGTFEYRDKSNFLNENNLKIEVDRIRFENKQLNSSDYELPYMIEFFNESSSNMKGHYKKRISEEFLLDTFVPLSRYNRNLKDSILKTNKKYRKISDLNKIYNKRYLK